MVDPRAHSEASIGRYLVYGGPLLWAALIVFHPNPGGDSPYEGIADVVDRWLFVHVGQLSAPAAIGFVALFLAGILSERERTKSAPGVPAVR